MLSTVLVEVALIVLLILANGFFAADVLRIVAASGFSRFPVYDGTIDQIVGILYIKDLLRAWGQHTPAGLRALLRAPTFLPESQRAVVAFQQLKQQQSGLAIVLDEYGQVAGLLTMADLIEEVVGPIDDEHARREQAIVRREDGSYLVAGLLPLTDLQQQADLAGLGADLRTRDYATVAGLALALFGRIPSPGEYVERRGYRLEVVDMDGRRVDTVLIQPPQG